MVSRFKFIPIDWQDDRAIFSDKVIPPKVSRLQSTNFLAIKSTTDVTKAGDNSPESPHKKQGLKKE